MLVLLVAACGESAATTQVATQGGETAMSTIIPTSDGQTASTDTPIQTGQGTPCPSVATLPLGTNSTTATVQSATNVPATTTLGAMTDVPLGTTVPNDPCPQVPSNAPSQASPTP